MIQKKINKRLSRKFIPPERFLKVFSKYYLLPFRFHPISDEREVLVNEVGDFLICPRGTATRIANREISPQDKIFPDLVAKFIISDTSIPSLVELLATRYRTKKAFLDEFTSLHIFVMTLRCNQSCHYCQVSSRTPESLVSDMSEKSLHSAISHMFKTKSKNITMEFQGGEPLLVFELVKSAVETALEMNTTYNKKITFVLCTNLIAITDEILRYCKKHDILISTSLDGPPSIHDANRPGTGSGSYDVVVQKIREVRNVLGPDKVSALLTATRDSLEKPKEIIDSYLENGFNHIFLRRVSPYGFAGNNKYKYHYTAEEFLKFYKIALKYIVELNQKGITIVEDYASIILTKILTPFPTGFVDLQSPSGIVNSVVAYNYDGAVYASDESRMLAESGDYSFRLGSVDEPYEALFFGAKAKEFSAYWANESLAGCSDCGFQAYCGADPVRNYVTQGDPEGYRPTSDHCIRNMEIIRFLFELMEQDENVARVFQEWVGGG